MVTKRSVSANKKKRFQKKKNLEVSTSVANGRLAWSVRRWIFSIFLFSNRSRPYSVEFCTFFGYPTRSTTTRKRRYHVDASGVFLFWRSGNVAFPNFRISHPLTESFVDYRVSMNFFKKNLCDSHGH